MRWMVSLILIVGSHFYSIATQLPAAPIASEQIGLPLGYANNAGIWGLIWNPKINTDSSRRFIQGMIDKCNHTIRRCHVALWAMPR